jgi:hypothetical protein
MAVHDVLLILQLGVPNLVLISPQRVPQVFKAAAMTSSKAANGIQTHILARLFQKAARRLLTKIRANLLRD